MTWEILESEMENIIDEVGKSELGRPFLSKHEIQTANHMRERKINNLPFKFIGEFNIPQRIPGDEKEKPLVLQNI